MFNKVTRDLGIPTSVVPTEASVVPETPIF